MTEKSILVPVRLDSAGFEAFAKFDTFYRRGTLRRIGLFIGILAVSACACFAFSNSENQGAMLGWVLLAIALVLPVVYLFTFFRDVRKKARQMGLEKPTLVYTISLTDQAVEFRPAKSGQEGRTTPWNEMFGAWRTKEAVYLYAAQNTAYLLPNGQAKGTDDGQLWAFIAARLAPEKLHDRAGR